MNRYQELINQIKGKTIESIVADSDDDENPAFDIVFTDGTVLELYADNLKWAYEENPDEISIKLLR